MIPVIVYTLAKSVIEAFTPGKTISWQEVKIWIAHVGNRRNFNIGHSSSRLPPKFGNGFVELRRSPLSGDMIRLEATLVFDPKQGAVTTHSWIGKPDKELEKVFGKNMRTRIKV